MADALHDALVTIIRDDPDTVAAIAATVGPHLDTLASSPGETIRPTHPGRDARALVERLRQDAGRPLELAAELGRGGMGVVRLATQAKLARSVAVKTLADDNQDPRYIAALLREAWTTGSVEHPNIVPLYDLALDDDGRPMLVFKRIEGRTWEALLEDDDLVRELFGVEDPFEWHARTLMQVCTAIHYAHRAGILHRDLKPDNVMVGDFGEVYVVDWGIALSLHDDGSGRLPLASAATGLAGTPAFMAPEMFTGRGDRLSPRTDVYQLGGLLHCIVTGEPPQTGTDPVRIVLDAVAEKRSWPEDMPVELRAIGDRALAADPNRRYPDVESFRRALQTFLERRAAHAVAASAAERFELLLAELATGPPGDDEARRRRRKLYNECAFGFRLALDAWADHPDAQVGLRQAGVAMVEDALADERVDAAEALLSDLETPPTGLVARVSEARAAEDARRAYTAAQLREQDLGTSRGARVALTCVMGAAFVAMPVWRWFNDLPRPPYPASMLGHLVMFTAAMIGLYLGRRRLLENVVNQRIMATLLLVIATLPFAEVASHYAGIPPDRANSVGQLVAFVIVGMLAIHVTARIAPAALGYLVAYVLGSMRPDLLDGLVILANAGLVVNIAWIWGFAHPSTRAD